MNISDQEQEESSHWLGTHTVDKPINLYYYQGEPNMGWLFHAIAFSKGVYLNCNNDSDITKWITSYVVLKMQVKGRLYDEV